jgi:hypothetical protein
MSLAGRTPGGKGQRSPSGNTGEEHRVAEKFLWDIEHADPQQVMARVTGSYRRGNERDGRRHQRNR